MALPSTGAISLNAVNVELGLSGTTTISMNQASVRTLFGVASGAISMSDGYGKSNVTAPALAGYTGFTSAANRTVWNTHAFSGNNAYVNSAGGFYLGFTVTGGGTITYEWQFLTWYGMYQGNCSPIAASSITWNNQYGYTDAISGLNTGTLTFTHVYGWASTSTYRGIEGYWRLAATNSAGTIYSGWYELSKQWDEYTYTCNCYCPGNNYDYCCTCECDENNENCTGCCGYYCCIGGDVCDTCIGYYSNSLGTNSSNYWCS
jgi:hypothetical protein